VPGQCTCAGQCGQLKQGHSGSWQGLHCITFPHLQSSPADSAERQRVQQLTLERWTGCSQPVCNCMVQGVHHDAASQSNST
jgi:hypothetical protein